MTSCFCSIDTTCELWYFMNRWICFTCFKFLSSDQYNLILWCFHNFAKFFSTTSIQCYFYADAFFTFTTSLNYSSFTFWKCWIILLHCLKSEIFFNNFKAWLTKAQFFNTISWCRCSFISTNFDDTILSFFTFNLNCLTCISIYFYISRYLTCFTI